MLTKTQFNEHFEHLFRHCDGVSFNKNRKNWFSSGFLDFLSIISICLGSFSIWSLFFGFLFSPMIEREPLFFLGWLLVLGISILVLWSSQKTEKKILSTNISRLNIHKDISDFIDSLETSSPFAGKFTLKDYKYFFDAYNSLIEAKGKAENIRLR